MHASKMVGGREAGLKLFQIISLILCKPTPFLLPPMMLMFLKGAITGKTVTATDSIVLYCIFILVSRPLAYDGL